MGAYTDINSDGKDEAIIAYNCDKGGASWPDNILVYDNNLNFLTVADYKKSSELTYLRSNLISMQWNESSVTINSRAWAEGDTSAKASTLVTLRLTMPGGQVKIEETSRKPLQS